MLRKVNRGNKKRTKGSYAVRRPRSGMLTVGHAQQKERGDVHARELSVRERPCFLFGNKQLLWGPSRMGDGCSDVFSFFVCLCLRVCLCHTFRARYK